MDFPDPPAPVESISPAALKRRIDDGEALTLLDTRNADEYETWHITGERVTTHNVPYTAFRGETLDEDTLDSIPTDREVVAVCAVGKSSAYVAGVLNEHGRDVAHLEDGMAGWARVYEAVEISQYSGPGRVWQYQRPSSGCLGYLVVSGGEAAVVDPLRAFTDRYLDDAERHGAALTRAIDTHVHADHVSGVRDLTATGVEGVVPAGAEDRGLADAGALTLAADGDRFRVGDVTVEAVQTPGHTTEMTSLLVDGELLLTGDGLFLESVARPDLEAGEVGTPAAARQLHESLQERVCSLPGETLVAPGHHAPATDRASDGTYTARLDGIRERLETLPMSRDAFVERVLADIPPPPANHERIIAVNLGQREINETEAFELELGPNNCAAGSPSAAD